MAGCLAALGAALARALRCVPPGQRWRAVCRLPDALAPTRLRCGRCALPLPESLRVLPAPLGSQASARCGACLSAPPPLAHCLAAVDYGWPWHALLARYKFQGRSGWARTLAARMRASPGATELLADAQVVLPMPISQERLAERGYHQAWLLARALSPDKSDEGLLLRIRHTPSQRGLPRSERLANLRGAFAVEPLRAQTLRGRSVLLVDDVDTAPVLTLGPRLEAHPAFPRKVNVGFLQVQSRSAVRLRVFERGSGETLACGTGACAAVVAGIRLGLLDRQVDVQTHGGRLTIAWDSGDNPVLMTGPATTVFEGEVEIPECQS